MIVRDVCIYYNVHSCVPVCVHVHTCASVKGLCIPMGL